MRGQQRGAAAGAGSEKEAARRSRGTRETRAQRRYPCGLPCGQPHAVHVHFYGSTNVEQHKKQHQPRAGHVWSWTCLELVAPRLLADEGGEDALLDLLNRLAQALLQTLAALQHLHGSVGRG